MTRSIRPLCHLLLCLGLMLTPLLPSGPGGGFAAHADDGDGGDGGGSGSGSGAGSGDSGGSTPEQPQGNSAFREVIAAGLSPAQLVGLQQLGYELLGQRSNALLGLTVSRLHVPLRALLIDAAAEVRALGGGVLADRNHYYRGSKGETQRPPQQQLIAWPARAGQCAVTAPIGLIDTRVDTENAALQGASIKLLSLPGQDPRRASDPAHGTAVAGLLVGQTPPWRGLLPRARLIAVDAFHRGRLGDERMDAWDLVAALDVLAAQGVRVINMSFAGAPNQLLEQVIAKVHKRQIVTVAAVGNRGPRAAPEYPAAYEGVIAVTAVDGERQIYHRAGRGAHVDLAAPGVDIPTANADGGNRNRSGTSFAAPFVTAAAATLLNRRSQSPATIRARLLSQAQDLGEPGHDPVYGHGLLQAGRFCGA